MTEEKSLQEIPNEITQQLHSVDFKPGDIFIDDRGDYIKVDKIYIDSGQDYKGETWHEVKVSYFYHLGSKWEYKSTATLKEWDRKNLCRVPNNDIEKSESDALKYLVNFEQEENLEVSASTALVMSQSEDKLKSALLSFEQKRELVEARKRMILRRVSALTTYVDGMSKQIKKLQKVLGVFELYLGFYEEIVQLTEGLKAADNEPLCIRQLVLFMDEEIISELPIDFNEISFPEIADFDNWVIDNYQKLVPESKGIVAMRPSRQKKPMYDMFGKLFYGEWPEDRICYLLIRNGQNLYRIYTQMDIGTLFFPDKKELAEFTADLEKHGEDSYQGEKLQDWQIRFNRNALLVQGLLDRTEIFNFSEHVSVLDLDSKYVKYIYDGEASLPDGRLPYKEWKKQLNEKIERGTRVYFSSFIFNREYSGDGDYKKQRFKRYYNRNSWNVPEYPESGVYSVEEIGEPSEYSRHEKLYIFYNPKDTVQFTNWEYDPHERKNRVGFILCKDDSFVFNYDLLDLDSIEYYLKSRYEKRHYLSLIPVLLGLRKERYAELEWEKHFVKLISDRNSVSESVVWEAVEWWKNKVIWKRPIMKDDAKALRMIERKVKKLED